MPQLSDLIHFSDKEHPSLDATVVIDVPVKDWPSDIRAKWGATVQLLVAQQKALPSIVDREDLCLCGEIKKCSVKSHLVERPECSRYCFGVCAEATVTSNDGQGIGYDPIGAVVGVTKQRIQQIQAAAMVKLRRRVSSDGVLVEFCQNLGIGGQSMSSREIVREVVDT